MARKLSEHIPKWVIDAFIKLLSQTSYKNITVDSVAKAAGIGRQTFYHYFKSIDDVVMQFLQEAANAGLVSIELETPAGGNVLLKYNYDFVRKHLETIKAFIEEPHIRNLIEERTQSGIKSAIEYYKNTLTPEEYSLCRYKLRYQIAGCLDVLTDWFHNEMPQSADTIVSIINTLAQTKNTILQRYPNVVLDIL